MYNKSPTKMFASTFHRNVFGVDAVVVKIAVNFGHFFNKEINIHKTQL